MTSPEQILGRIDRALAELTAIRADLAPAASKDELTPDEERELAELAAKRVARMRRARPVQR